jgi:hypothetical protein
MHENLSSDFGSFLLSSDSEGEGVDGDNSTTEERELFENDWNLFSSLKSLFSSDNDSVEPLEGNLGLVLDVLNVFDPDEENQEEQSFVFTESDDQQETDDESIDIEGNYNCNDGDDIEEDISFT